jgi:hypothetical protein
VSATSTRAAGLTVAVEGVALTVGGCVLLVLAATGRPHSRAVALFAGALALVGGLLLVLLARGLSSARRWARTPVLLLNLLAVPIGIGLVQAGRLAVGVPLSVVSASVVVLLFVPAR